MPIHRDSYPDEVDLTPGTAKSQIVVFLYNNLELAYTPSEIADHLDLKPGTVNPTLTRLHENGYIGRMERGHYHGLDGRNDLIRYSKSVEEAERMFAHHPDNEDAPEPNPQRAAETEKISDEALRNEIDSFDDELGESE